MLKSAPLPLEALARVFDNSEDCVKLVDANGRLLWMNEGGLCAMEIDDFALVEGGDWAGFWPEEHAPTVRGAYEARPAAMTRFDAFCPTAKGTPKWWEVTVTPVDDDEGGLFGFMAVSRDVTERRVAAETRELLLREMRHRQGNTLALVSALMRMHGGASPETKGFVRAMSERLAALGRAQGLVGERVVGAGETLVLRDVVAALAEPLAGPDCTLTLDVPEGLELPRAHLDVVGVILGELAVNAAKHGAFAQGGTVAVSARAEADGRLTIRWAEAPREPIGATEREGGQGIELMGRIARAKGAAFGVDWFDDRLEARLELPAAA